jgi:DNA-binding MarR family transcriptional regulator
VKKNTITSLLKGLEESGLIERAPDPADRRAALVRISPAGRELVRSTAPARFAFLNRAAAGLDAGERRQLLELLNKLRASLQPHACCRPSVED